MSKANSPSFILYDRLEQARLEICTEQTAAIDRARVLAGESGIDVVVYSMTHIATVSPSKT